MSYTLLKNRRSPNYSAGRPYGKPNVIVIHYWDDPAKKPQFDGVVNWLCRSNGDSSAHYVAEAGRVAEIVSPDNRAWHAGSGGNPRGIGIECNPRKNAGDLETVAELIADIRRKYGNLPLQPHNYYMNTSCPGNWKDSLVWLSKRADEILAGKKPSTSAPSKPSSSALVVDGIFGNASVKKLQAVLGTQQDGFISDQWSGNKQFYPALTAVKHLDSSNAGSSLVYALQRKLGVSADGYFGKNTIIAWQRKLGVSADGYFGASTAKAAQRALNNNKLW